MRFSFQRDISHQLDDKLGESDNFQAWNYRISPFLERNVLDTYISREVPFPEGDEAKSLTQEEARLVIREKKMGAIEDQALTMQRRSLKR